MTLWKSFTVAACREAVDALSHFFFLRGALGTSSDERLFDPAGDPALPIPPPGETTTLTAWFPAGADLAAIEEAFRDFLPVLEASFGPGAAAFLSSETVEDPGWGEAWKDYFRPVRAGERIVVRPSWERHEAGPSDVVVVVDPGQAFGTGTHETTRLCLRHLEEAFAAPRPPRRVLDVGTGTGILGIAAALLGAEEVLGIDVDPKAVETAAENGRVNGVAGTFRASAAPLSCVAGTFDLVLANVHAEVLVEMRDDLAARLAPGGRLVLSGIIAGKAAGVAAEFAAAGLSPLASRTDGPWTSLVLGRDA